MNLPTTKELAIMARKRRDDYLADLRARVDELQSAGGEVSYQTALEVCHAAVRFAAQIASVDEFAAKA